MPYNREKKSAYAKIYYEIHKDEFALQYWRKREELRAKREAAKLGTFKPPTKHRVQRKNWDHPVFKAGQ